jgi:lipopolysaccharide transport system permease protein
MVWYQFIPGWRIITLPFFLMLSLFASLGFGLWIAALNVKYRDFRLLTHLSLFQ